MRSIVLNVHSESTNQSIQVQFSLVQPEQYFILKLRICKICIDFMH